MHSFSTQHSQLMHELFQVNRLLSMRYIGGAGRACLHNNHYQTLFLPDTQQVPPLVYRVIGRRELPGSNRIFRFFEKGCSPTTTTVFTARLAVGFAPPSYRPAVSFCGRTGFCRSGAALGGGLGGYWLDSWLVWSFRYRATPRLPMLQRM